MQQIIPPILDIRSILSSRRVSLVFGPKDVCYAKITTKKNIISQQIRIFRCNIVGKDTSPQSLCVLANKIIQKTQVVNRIKSQCIFIIRNIYTEEDIKITISVPGTLEMVLYDSKLIEKSLSHKSTLSEIYISSVLRYMFSLIEPIKGYYYDPFENGYDSFKQIMNKLIEFELTYKKTVELVLNYQQMTKLLGNSFHMVAIFINRMKMHSWLQRYYNQPIIIQFICESFGSNPQNSLIKSILNNQDINDMWMYYLSLGTSQDRRTQILKKLSYLNKVQIWLFLADSYINYHITNLTMVSKGLQILDILAQRKNYCIQTIHPYLNINLNQQIHLSAINVFMLPHSPVCYYLKRKIKSSSYIIEQEITNLKQLINKYYNLNLLQRSIIRKLSFLINQIGYDKTQKLFPKVFDQQFVNQQTLYYNIKPLRKRKQTLQSQQQYNIPSFVDESQQLIQNNILSTATINFNTQQSTKAELWSITQQNITPREDQQISIVVRYDPIQYCKKKYSKIALDMNQNITKVFETLQIKNSQTNHIINLKLHIEDILVLAQVSQISEKNKIALSLYNNVNSKIFDTYTIWKIIKLSGKINQFCSQLITINQLVEDCHIYSKINLSSLPLWVEQHLFSTLKKKGTIFVQALLKSNNISQTAITKSIKKYESLTK